MTKSNRIGLMALLATALLALASCSKPTRPISIGINAWPGYEYIYLAQVQGFYEKRGVEVKIVSYNSLADARRAFEHGNLDGLACTLIEHCQILDNSARNPRIAMVADYSAGGDVVIAREGIDQIAQLAGAKIGLEVESLGVFILARLLERAGLDLEDVVPVKTDQLSLKQQMQEGVIDAAITYPPHSLAILDTPGNKIIFSTSEIPNEVLDIVVFDEATVQSREAEVHSIIEAIYEAQDWAKDNKQEAYSIMARREGISPEEFAEIIENDIHVTGRDEQEAFFADGGLLLQALQSCTAILRETGQISNPDRYEDSISPSLFRGVK